jgi:hypothetical protein
MWLEMLGLGGIAATVNDPGFHAQIKAFAAAQFETLERVRRIELKLDLLLQASAIDAADRQLAALPLGMGTDGAGVAAVAGGTSDDGARAAQDKPWRVAGGHGGADR